MDQNEGNSPRRVGINIEAKLIIDGQVVVNTLLVGPYAATLPGMRTGIGGGMVRDVLVSEIPTVLRTELYAVAALIGAAVVVVGRMLHAATSAAAVAGAVLCFGLRFIAIQ